MMRPGIVALVVCSKPESRPPRCNTMLNEGGAADDKKSTMLLSHPSDGLGSSSPQESASLGSEDGAITVSTNDNEDGFAQASQSARVDSSADMDKVRALLDRIKDEVRSKQEQQDQGDKTKVSVDLSEEDLLLLTGLLENGTIDRSSKLASALESSMREMTMIQHAHLISRVKGDGHWPVNVGFRDITYSVNVPTKDIGIPNVANAMAALAPESIRLARRSAAVALRSLARIVIVVREVVVAAAAADVGAVAAVVGVDAAVV
ncbi:Hypothetical Protein FCC1311_111952 [Hondaea fermentalgiana]|uniref:Uncharacterized protein n=1 Tax=Hondaea fermentalgiana TaxID=2315210 RepID=A0A2R5GVV3_9STRA|nr:Hypothetical Protein FCC1311_111952 [Hondaea fermentalgiana]|eukprot:GBG34972.1 Hypothetical Protein FCC1311_111952 [Hondaea fermentalgiana]